MFIVKYVLGVVLILIIVLLPIFASIHLAKTNKVEKHRIPFYISFLPHVLLICASIYSGINGADFYGMMYGMDAFLWIFGVVGLILCTIIPIIPACAIYQIVYIAKIKKRKKLHKLDSLRDALDDNS